jgi:hypothetical protein
MVVWNEKVAPVCPYGYYEAPPYNCAPDDYYGPEWLIRRSGVGRFPVHFYCSPAFFTPAEANCVSIFRMSSDGNWSSTAPVSRNPSSGPRTPNSSSVRFNDFESVFLTQYTSGT